MKKVRKILTDMKLTTTPTPIRAGRNPAYYPILVLPADGCQIDDIQEVLDFYPIGSYYLKRVSDRHQVLDVYDVWEAGADRIARYRYHPKHGWLEEITKTWTVNADYPTALASGTIIKADDQGIINLTAAMRFGVQVISLLLGNDDSAVRNEILDLLAKIMLRANRDDFIQRIEIDNEKIKLSL